MTREKIVALARRGLVVGAMLACVAGAVSAQEKYPSRPVEVIVPWGAGGGSDQTARMIAKYLEADLKASFPVVNVPGASGVTGVQKLLLNPADGYSLGVSGDYYAILGSPKAKWKLSDFIPIAIVINQAGAIFVAKDSRFKTWADVEKEARAKPNSLKIAMAGYGIIDEIHTNYLLAKGIKLNVVPYNNPSERYVSILGGHVDLLYEQAGDLKSYINNHQMRPLLSVTAQRFPLYPDVPTTVENGYNITVPQVRWVYMKAGTPPSRVKVIADSLERMSRTPEFKAYLASEYADPASFVPLSKARGFLQQMIDSVRREASEAGLKAAK
jgi:tripartite-type tricarboxylate transporter receptor subunit TctC